MPICVVVIFEYESEDSRGQQIWGDNLLNKGYCMKDSCMKKMNGQERGILIVKEVPTPTSL